MSSDDLEINKFKTKILKPHRRVNPCFMTGKGCVYTEQIDREIELRKNKKANCGFMILPFQPNISVFFELCLKRYIQGAYGKPDEPMEIIRADQVRKTGYVICEKICKKIQEADFVMADVSVPNANVFYELGLAYGIGHKILVVYHKGSKIGDYISNYFSGCMAYSYTDLTPLTIGQFQVSSYLWERENRSPIIESTPITLLIDTLNAPGIKPENAKISPANEQQKPNAEDIDLNFSTHAGAAVGVAVDNIQKRIRELQQTIKIPTTYYSLIDQLKNADLVQSNASFREILEKINQSFCTLIKTGGKDCNPMVYFWLGYCHAQGRNVIPITVIGKKKDKEEEKKDDIDDLAFDIRALWHMTFEEDFPVRLEGELEETMYQMVISDFAEWSRRRFWDEVLEKRGKVSVFTGALHNPIGREMIGDWDLRAASELTSYFASHQYRATIESPVYQIEQVVEKQRAVERDQYIKELEKMLSGKNCVIIASPDVNPLTEIVLGKIYGIPRENWFDPNFNAEGVPNAVVAFKQTDAHAKDHANSQDVKRTFYREEFADDIKDNPERGFKASFLDNRKIFGQFISQTETENPSEFIVHAHLAIVPNPYSNETEEEQKYIILLNGVSGPATFALTHVLTGGVSKEFVSYGDFDPNSESEKIMKQILEDLNSIKKKKQPTGVQYIIQVKVGPPQVHESQDRGSSRGIFDWRHISHWELVKSTSMFPLKV